MTRTFVIFLATFTLLLTACGDPNPPLPPSPPPPLDPETVQELVNGEEPIEKYYKSLLRIQNMQGRANHLLVSNGYIETETGADVVMETNCEGDSCDFSFNGEVVSTWDTKNLFRSSSAGSNTQSGSNAQSGSVRPPPSKSLFSIEDITLIETSIPNNSIFYAALNHSAFGIIRMWNRETGARGVFAGVYGDRWLYPSSVSGIWKGSMSGVTKGGQRDFLHGTALIDYSSSGTGTGGGCFGYFCRH